MVCWEYVPLPEYEVSTSLLHALISTFVRLHVGYRMKEMFAFQAENSLRLQWVIDTGGWFWDASAQGYVKTLSKPFEDLCREPHVVGSMRDLEVERPSSLIGALFFCEPPRLGFSPREQQLLMAALRGESATDPELAAALRVSVSVVKKMWLSIYRRADSLLPGLIPASASPYHVAWEPQGERGKEKRRTLLAYLRDHPEELRPYSRRLSAAHASQHAREMDAK